jgi:YidC/Oxa1 family membrane protein insertase
MIENRNTILAVILSGLVLIAWQYFYNIPTMEKQRRAAGRACAKAGRQPDTDTGQRRRTRQRPAASAAPAPATAVPVQPRNRDRRFAAREDRHAEHFRQHFADRRTHR